MHSLRNRILLFFTIFALVSLVAVFMSSRSTKVVGEAADAVANEHLPVVHALGAMEVALLNQDVAIYHYVTSAEKKWKDRFEEAKTDFDRLFLEVQRGASVQEEKDRLRLIDELYVQYENQARQILLTPRSQSQTVKAMLAKCDQFLGQIHTLIKQINGLRQGMTYVRQEQIRDTLRHHEGIAYYFITAIFFFFILLAVYLWHYLVKPLTLLLGGIQNFTRGRLDIQIPSIGKDELGELQEAFNEMSREIAVERKKLKTESQSDSLTGLFNMRYFRRQLADEFSRAQRYTHPLTLLMVDVDHFKMYNDQNGHPAGDIVLKEISRIMVRNVRGTDIVARYGGEEFVILLPETSLEAAGKVAEKIRNAVEFHHFPFQESMANGKLTVSVGVAGYPDDHIPSDRDLVEASDKAMYTAKKWGRNQVCLFPEIDGHPPRTKPKKTPATHHPHHHPKK